MRTYVPFIALTLALAACHPALVTAPAPTKAAIICGADNCGPSTDAVDITYLGVGGFMIAANGKVLLTAPQFTNPSLVEVAPRVFTKPPRLHPDRELIASLLPPQAYGASAILIGHGHYDHTLDIPFIADSLATRALVYGGPSIRNMLSGDRDLRPRLRAIGGDSVGTADSAGTWITTPDSAFRFMALASSHAPAFRMGGYRYDYVRGTVPDTLSELPRRARDWKVGETYAYLIDVLGAGGRPVFRIYYQDAANDSALGIPAMNLRDRAVDVAILCVANARDARPPAPDALLDALRPRYVIAGHWEIFLWPQVNGVYRSPVSDFDAFAESLRTHAPDAEWSAPRPMDRYRFSTRP